MCGGGWVGECGWVWVSVNVCVGGWVAECGCECVCVGGECGCGWVGVNVCVWVCGCVYVHACMQMAVGVSVRRWMYEVTHIKIYK